MIERYGPQAVMPLNYAGPHGMLSLDSMSLRFFHKLGASQLYRRSMCGAVRSEAWAGTYGAVPGIGPEAAADAALNIVWGNNATVANLHLVRQIRNAQAQGRQAGGDRSAAHQDRRAGGPAPCGAARAPTWCSASRSPPSWSASARTIRRSSRKHVLGYDEFMALAREWPVEQAAEVCGVPAERHPHARALDGGGRSAGDGAGATGWSAAATAAAACAPRSRCRR